MFRKTTAAMALVVGTVLAPTTFGAVAYADDIANNLDTSIDATLETMSLTVGGSSATTTLYVNPTNDDGKNGCNLTGSKTFTANVSSSDPTKATVSPSQVTFTSCGDTKVLTVTPQGQGSADITLSQVANTTDGSFNLAPAAFTVNVAAAAPVVTNTAPVLSLPADIGPLEANTLGGRQVTFTAAASDAEDGPLTPLCSPASGSLFPVGETIVECSVTDSGGLTDTGSFTVTVQDTTPPQLSDVPADSHATFSTSAGGAVVSWTEPTGYDIVDGPVNAACRSATGLVSGDLFPLGPTQVTCSAEDQAGNQSSASFDVAVRYASTGLLQPINADGSSAFKLGSTVPVKLALVGASAGHSGGNLSIKLTKLGTTPEGNVVEAVVSTSAHTGNVLRYDAGSDQYVFNLGTKTLSVGLFRVEVDLGDGSTPRQQVFSLRK